MKPDFALFLSFEGITLLQRVAGGWAPVGEVALDAADLKGALGDLRARADALSPRGGQVKLVIPNEQIRYLTIPRPAGDADLHAAIESALEGATPYAVGDLVYDWSGSGDTVQIAAVARETLAEAQGFAASHHFDPVAYVAVAPKGAFDGEVFLGAAPDWTGPTPERDDRAIVQVAAPVAAKPNPPPAPKPQVKAEPEPQVKPDMRPEAAPAPPPKPGPQPEPKAEPKPAPQPEAKAEAKPASQPEAKAEPKPAPQPEAKAEPKPAPQPEAKAEPAAKTAADAPKTAPGSVPVSAAAPKPEPVPGETDRAQTDAAAALAPGAADADKPAPTGAPGPAVLKVPQPERSAGVTAPGIEQHTVSDTPPPAFSSIRATRSDPGTAGKAPSLNVPYRDDTIAARITPVPVAPRAPTSPDLTAPAALAVASLTREPVTTPEPDPEAVPVATAKPSRFGGFFSRRSAPPAEPATPEPDTPATAAATATTRGKAKADAADKSPPRPVVTSALARVAALRGKGGKPGQQPTPQDAERDRMTVFGARRTAAIGGKPRFLGLMLTALLLLFLAAVAAWASVFVDEGLARFFRKDVSPAVAVAEADVTSLPTSEVEQEADAPLELAALDVALPPADRDDQPTALAQPERPGALSEVEADATYAATGIWQRAPPSPMEPAQGDIENLYVAGIDPQVRQFDAVALPGAVRTDDPAFVSPPLPAPAGTVFDLDSRGLVRAVPEGAMNADGILIYAGLPPVIPPRRGVAAAPAPVDTPETRAIQDQLQRLRPEARPDGIVEQNERATLAGRSRAELAALRPAARPEVTKLAEEADVTATAQAVDTSRKPLPRPRDITRIVDEARARATAQPEAKAEVQVASAAAVAPRTVAPSIPSKTTVAKQATVRNAINLRKLNLIGVYGKPSSRRALVRLANGRYQKVKVGDRIDGGRVAAIGEAELRYTKGGRNIVLTMPRG